MCWLRLRSLLLPASNRCVVAVVAAAAASAAASAGAVAASVGVGLPFACARHNQLLCILRRVKSFLNTKTFAPSPSLRTSARNECELPTANCELCCEFYAVASSLVAECVERAALPSSTFCC